MSGLTPDIYFRRSKSVQSSVDIIKNSLPLGSLTKPEENIVCSDKVQLHGRGPYNFLSQSHLGLRNLKQMSTNFLNGGKLF